MYTIPHYYSSYICYEISNASNLKHLNPVVLSITHEYVSVRHDGDAFEPFEFSVTRSPASKSSQKRGVRMEYLDAVVAGICHQYVSLVVYGHTSRTKKKKFHHYSAAVL